MRAKAPESLCAGGLSKSKEKDAAHRADTLPGRLQTGRAQGTSVAIAWREYQLHSKTAKERL